MYKLSRVRRYDRCHRGFIPFVSYITIKDKFSIAETVEFVHRNVLQFNNLFDYASIKMRVKWTKRKVHYVLWFRLQLRVFSLSYDINVIKHQAALC